jgi:pimeloyl-ACP methyl ester carboxylesterase
LLLDQPEVADLARSFLDLIDALGLGRVLVYGMHTGAAIAAELAIMAPDRVAGVVLDGIADFRGDALVDVLAHYAPRFEPDLDGAMLQRVFQFCRDQFLFFPWYARDPSHPLSRSARRDSGLPLPADLYGWVVEVLKAHGSYHRNYHAAFRWAARARLPLVGCPLVVTCSASDPLAGMTQGLAAALARDFVLLPRFDAPDYARQRLALLTKPL